MASFTDSEVVLSPYVQQQPIEAMRTAGMLREQRFQEGIQTVQSMYDSLLALPLAKKEDQEYVKQKVNSLNNVVRQSISGDFSNQRLINQIGGLASQISNDPTVQTGVQSTAKMQAGFTKAKADQERALKEGKNPTNNINDFNDRVNEYMSDGQTGSEFKGEYTPFIDIMDRTLEYYGKLNPGQTLATDAIRWNPDTKSYEVNEILYDGVDAKRIQNVLNIVYSQPDVQAQIGVDGRQKFKGMDPSAMSKYLEESSNKQVDEINASIVELQTKAVTDNTIDKQAALDNIKFLTDKGNNLVKDFNEAMEVLKGNNPDALKSALVWGDFTSSFTSAYTNNVMKKSPMFDAFMEKERLKDSRAEFSWKQEVDRFNATMRQKEFSLSEFKATLEKQGDSPIAAVTPLSIESQQGKLGAETAESDLENTKNAYVQKTNELVNSIAMSTPATPGQKSIPPPYTYREDLGAWVPNTKGIKEYYSNPNMSDQEVAAKAQQLKDQMLSTVTDQYNSGKMADEGLIPLYEEGLDIWYRMKDKERIVEKVEAEFAPSKEKLKQQIGNEDFASLYIIQKQMPGADAEAKKLVRKYGNQYANQYGETLQETLSAIAVAANFPTGTKHLGKLLTSLGVDPVQYFASIRNVDEVGIDEALQKREASYKRQQYALNSNKVTFDISKPEKRKEILTAMGSLASEPSLMGGNATSDYDSFMKQMNEKDFDEFTLLEAYYDEFKKTGVIRGFKGKKEYSFEVPKEALMRVFPDVVAENKFLKYEQRMRYANEQGRGRTTDVTGNGGEGYPVYHPLYNVRYHVVDLGGKYDIQYYITDRSGKAIITKKSLAGPVDEASIETLVDKNLKNVEFVNSIVKEQSTNKQLKALGQ